MGLATPLAIVIASGLCSKKGILIKDSESLENAHKAKTVVFDKTGTLTQGKLSISRILKYENIDEKELLQQVASIENKSEHPIAKAILNKAKEEKIELIEVSEFEAVPGYGIKANIKEYSFLIGNRKLMEENSIEINNKDDEIKLTKEGNSVLFVARNKKLIALIGVNDIIKPHIKETIQTLKEKNIDILMLTGDNDNAAKVIANEIGINKVIANVTPNEKAKKIEELKKDGIVIMCGDGINDSVSLVASDIGISISNGTDIAIDSAKVVLMNDDLNKINELIDISKRTIRNIKQNLFWAFFYNICMIPIAFGIFSGIGITLNPMIASFAMTISSLTVVLNALRLKN